MCKHVVYTTIVNFQMNIVYRHKIKNRKEEKKKSIKLTIFMFFPSVTIMASASQWWRHRQILHDILKGLIQILATPLDMVCGWKCNNIATTRISPCHWKTVAPFCLRKKRPKNAFFKLTVNYRKIVQKNKLCHSKQQ